MVGHLGRIFEEAFESFSKDVSIKWSCLPLARMGGGGRRFPFHESFLLQFGPIWSRGESKRNLRPEDRGSKLLPLYRWTNYITLVTILFEILFRVCLLPIFFHLLLRFGFFFFFFPRLGEHIFHSLIKPYIFGWDNVFLHFWDDSVLSILVNKSAILDKIQSVCLFMRLLTL